MATQEVLTTSQISNDVPTSLITTTTTTTEVETETETEMETIVESVPTEAPTSQPTEGPKYVLYKLTAYCPCEICCGKSDGITSIGVKATAGRTIAVDPNMIPFGSEVVINGHTYVAEDSGGSIKDNRIDVFFDNHHEAVEFGVQYAEVEVR